MALACVKMAEDTDERTIELTIEALTGTVYDLCVSPYETILGIKLKVQRLEGERMAATYLKASWGDNQCCGGLDQLIRLTVWASMFKGVWLGSVWSVNERLPPTGIPVYQQQLVWGGTELQDEFCLEEYSIPSGAQLKLLVAMRGGPIHAQRGI